MSGSYNNQRVDYPDYSRGPPPRGAGSEYPRQEMRQDHYEYRDDPREIRGGGRPETRYDDRAMSYGLPAQPAWEQQRGGQEEPLNKRGRYDDYNQPREFDRQASAVAVPRYDAYAQSQPPSQPSRHYAAQQEPYQSAPAPIYNDGNDARSSRGMVRDPRGGYAGNYSPEPQSRPYARPRQGSDEYYNSKREPRRHQSAERNDYPDRDLRDSHDQRDSRNQRDRPRNNSRRQDVDTPEPPSASVVLLGLPIHVTDQILRQFLEDLGASIDRTTIITDRITGISKRYGFANFSSVEHARAFVEPNYPSVIWKEPGAMQPTQDDGLKIKINFSQKTGGWREDQGAASRMTDDRKSDSVSAPFYVNDGTRDIGSAPTQILLLRGLDTLTTEENIVYVLGAIGGRIGKDIRDGGIKRVMITKDRASRSSWGYAFVQFADVRLATEVLSSVFNSTVYPTGFRIRSSVVAFSFCHENSFIPVYAPSEWSIKGEGGQDLTYWDGKAFISAWSPRQRKNSKEQHVVKPTLEEQKQLDADADMEAFFTSIEAEVPLASMQASNPATTEFAPELLNHSTPQVSASNSTTTNINAGPGSLPSVIDVEEGLKASLKARKPSKESNDTSKASQDKKKNDLIETKKAAVNISKWNVKQQELSVPTTSTAPASTSTPLPVSKVVAAVLSAVAVDASDTLAFADTVTNVCLLCQRQFKDLPNLQRHNSLSALHKTNLTLPTVVAEAALRRIAAKTAATALASTSAPAPTSTEPIDTAASKYVDRAAARRENFAQPDHPSSSNNTRSKRQLAGPPPPPPPPVQPNKDGIEASNVGSKMLEKMGWSKGAGLGAEGGGIVAPIIASSFAQGAGLGSSKGVAVGTEVGGYAERLRESARNRLAKE